jgi:hypothetical protein
VGRVPAEILKMFMKGEIVQCIFKPVKKDDWVVLKTVQNTYTLRLGGYKKETGSIQILDFEETTFPFKGCKIVEVYTDDFWVYILLDSGGVISSGIVDMSFSGEAKLAVQFENISEYDKDFFLSENLFKLTTAETGWSSRSTPRRFST